MPNPIADSHVVHYLEHGYAVITDFLTPDDLARGRKEVDDHLPGWRDFADDPTNPVPELPGPAAASLPFDGQILNSVATCEPIRDFVATLVGHDDLLLVHSDLFAKRAGGGMDDDQALHCDFERHTLTYPSDVPAYRQVEFILYWTDVGPDQAPTAVVSKTHYADELLWPPFRSREDRPDLYEREQALTVRAGTLFAYGMRTFHRGTKFSTPGARVVQFIGYAPANCPWMGAWAGRSLTPAWRALVEQSTSEERHALGFPPPGHPFWTLETVSGVSARYPKLDMSPYEAGVMHGV